MANPLRIRRRLAGGAAGAPSALLNAELAFNEQDETLYYGKGLGALDAATAILAIGGPGAYATLNTAQSITGQKTFTAPKLASAGAGFVRTDSAGVMSSSALLASDIPTITAAKISDFDTQVRTNRLDQLAVPTADLSLNSKKITNLADPSGAQDAATKAYVDAMATGLDVKGSVKAATTANITLSGTQTIDDVALSVGDRVLVKNQTGTGADNGIYVVASGGWTRATDADSSTEVTPGMFCFVEQGTVNSDTGWVLSTDGVITLGTTGLSFVQFSGAGQIVAGNGLTKTGSTLDVVGTAGRIAVSADAIDIDANYVGQTSITTLGTIATGTWNATTISVAKGGTGATTLTGLVKGNGTTAFSAAVAGTDYHDTNSTIDGGTF